MRWGTDVRAEEQGENAEQVVQGWACLRQRGGGGVNESTLCWFPAAAVTNAHNLVV